MRLRSIFIIGVMLVLGVKANAQLAGIASVTTSPSTWSYTVTNQELSGSPNYIGYFTLYCNAPVKVTGTPAGWADDTDGFSYVLWYNTDTALPYPHDIAPGASLSGFTIQSTVTTSDNFEYDLDSWDHSQDAPGPGTAGTILAPSNAAPVPESSTFVSFSALLFLGGIGLAARKRARRTA